MASSQAVNVSVCLSVGIARNSGSVSFAWGVVGVQGHTTGALTLVRALSDQPQALALYLGFIVSHDPHRKLSNGSFKQNK